MSLEIIKRVNLEKLNNGVAKIRTGALKVIKMEIKMTNNTIKKAVVECPYPDCIKSSGNYAQKTISLKVERNNALSFGAYYKHFRSYHNRQPQPPTTDNNQN